MLYSIYSYETGKFLLQLIASQVTPGQKQHQQHREPQQVTEGLLYWYQEMSTGRQLCSTQQYLAGGSTVSFCLTVRKFCCMLYMSHSLGNKPFTSFTLCHHFRMHDQPRPHGRIIKTQQAIQNSAIRSHVHYMDLT